MSSNYNGFISNSSSTQTPTQFCKAITLQLKNKLFKKDQKNSPYVSNKNLEGRHAVCLLGLGGLITSLVSYMLYSTPRNHTRHRL